MKADFERIKKTSLGNGNPELDESEVIIKITAVILVCYTSADCGQDPQTKSGCLMSKA